MKNIATAFVKAKRTFSPALKDKTNPHFRSKYADLGACLEAVNDALLENGIAVYQETHEDSTGVTVETVLLHESGEALRSGKLHVPAAKQDPQGYGSALTYARRYSLMTACGIAPEDDDGNAAVKAKDTAAVKHEALLKPIPADREVILQLAASAAIARWKKDDQIGAYEEISGITEPEEKMRLWQYLKDHSALRQFIKDHAQSLRETEGEFA